MIAIVGLGLVLWLASAAVAWIVLLVIPHWWRGRTAHPSTPALIWLISSRDGQTTIRRLHGGPDSITAPCVLCGRPWHSYAVEPICDAHTTVERDAQVRKETEANWARWAARERTDIAQMARARQITWAEGVPMGDQS